MPRVLTYPSYRYFCKHESNPRPAQEQLRGQQSGWGFVTLRSGREELRKLSKRRKETAGAYKLLNITIV